MSQYLDDLIIPLATIAGALIVGVAIERLIIKYLYKYFKHRAWHTLRRLLRSFNGLITLWFGLLALRAVLPDLPIRSKYVPLIEHVDSALSILTLTILFARIIIALVRSRSDESGAQRQSISLIENITKIVVYVIGLLFIFRTFGVAVTPILTALGVGGLAVALALQDTLSNLFAGIYIILSKNLSVGDYVKLDPGGAEGVIRDIAWRVTTLETLGKTLIIIPNNKISTGIVTNFDKPEKYADLIVPFTIDTATTQPKEFASRLQQVADRLAADRSDSVLATAIEYTMLSSTQTTLQLVVRLKHYSVQNEVRDTVIREMLKGSDSAAVSEAP